MTTTTTMTRFLAPTLMAFLLVGCYNVIPPGSVGLKTFAGTLNEDVVESGLDFNISDMTFVSLQAQSFRVEFDDRSPRAAVSSDMQTVGFSVDVSYHVASGEAAKELYRHINRDPSQWQMLLIEPVVEQAVKTVFAKYTLRELVATRDQLRQELSALIIALVTERLTERHANLAGALRIVQVTLTNIDYSEGFEQVVEATQREEQRARLAENELNRIRIESERQIVEAEAGRRASVERSRGIAESIEIEATARANSFRLLAEAGVDPNIFILAEKWNGVLPTVTSSGSDSSPFLLSLPVPSAE